MWWQKQCFGGFKAIEEPPQVKEGRVKKAQSTGEDVIGEAKELIARRLGVPLEKVQLEVKLVD